MQSLLYLLLLVACFCSGSGAEAPSILFILADDLGYGDLSVYPNPNTTHGRISTPNLDGQSMMFTDAYAGAPVCAPSRCTLMTGRHTGHCTVRQNGQFLNASDITVATILKKAGYSTALIGKWGLAPARVANLPDPGGAALQGTLNDPKAFNLPNPEGFDLFFGYNDQTRCHNYYPYCLWLNKNQQCYSKNKNASVENCGYPYTEHCIWSQDLFINGTLSYLKNISQQDKPFYLFLSFTTPHAGAVGSDAETGVPAPYETSQYAKQSWPKVERDFASVITIQDQQVVTGNNSLITNGQVLKALDDYKLTNSTVVFYASDNGAHNEGGHDYHFFESSGPLRGYKRSLHEGGVRSPLLVRWPGVTKGGMVSNQQWGFWDFMSTAADIAGIPESTLPPNDGYSLVPTLKGQAQDQPKYIYHEYCSPNEDRSGWGQAVRFQNWKAVRYDMKEEVELYDLSKDIGEQSDVSHLNPSMVQQAVKYMDEAHVPGPKCHGEMERPEEL